MRKKLEDLLLQIGITPNLKGFTYICDMVEIIKADEKRERKFRICIWRLLRKTIQIGVPWKEQLDTHYQRRTRNLKRGRNT